MHKRSRILLAIVVIVAGLLVSALVFSSSLFSAGPKSQETGTLAVLLTDPPSLPNGATALYMNYGSVQVHSTSDIAATSSSSDWIDLGASGVLNLTSLVNATQTIASVSVPTATYDSLRFSVASFIVTFQGSNYTSPFMSESGIVTIPLDSHVSVANGQISALLVNFMPVVFSSNVQSIPRFNVSGSAQVYPLPPQALSPTSTQLGNRTSIGSASWWANMQSSIKLELQSVQITPNSLSITVKNEGTSSITLNTAEITSFSSSTSSVGMFPSVAVSEFFSANPDGSLSPVSASAQSQSTFTTSASGGYVLQPNTVATPTYSGSISLQSNDIGLPHQNIVVGNIYFVSLWGSGGFNQITATAT